jgi:hypothetical protein
MKRMMHTQLADASDYVKKSFDITESSADNLFTPILATVIP